MRVDIYITSQFTGRVTRSFFCRGLDKPGGWGTWAVRKAAGREEAIMRGKKPNGAWQRGGCRPQRRT